LERVGAELRFELQGSSERPSANKLPHQQSHQAFAAVVADEEQSGDLPRGREGRRFKSKYFQTQQLCQHSTQCSLPVFILEQIPRKQKRISGQIRWVLIGHRVNRTVIKQLSEKRRKKNRISIAREKRFILQIRWFWD